MSKHILVKAVGSFKLRPRPEGDIFGVAFIDITAQYRRDNYVWKQRIAVPVGPNTPPVNPGFMKIVNEADGDFDDADTQKLEAELAKIIVEAQRCFQGAPRT